LHAAAAASSGETALGELLGAKSDVQLHLVAQLAVQSRFAQRVRQAKPELTRRHPALSRSTQVAE
jgi:hypothetical protein